MSGLRRLASTATMRKVGTRAPLQSTDWNTAISEILSTISALSVEWNTNLQPIVDSLPQGTRRIALANRQAVPDPVVNGLDGDNVYMDIVASTTRDEGLFWHSTLARPRTVKESVLEIRNQMLTVLGDLEAQIVNIDENNGLTDAQKARIGINIFDPLQGNAANSNEGRSVLNQANLNQLAADCYAVGRNIGDPLNGADYGFDGDGAGDFAESLYERILANNAAIAALGAITLDNAYTNGQVANVDLPIPFTINKVNGLDPDTVLITNALADATEGLRISRTNAGAGGYALHVDDGISLFDDTVEMLLSSAAAAYRGIQIDYTKTGATGGPNSAIFSEINHTGTGTGFTSALVANIPAGFTNNSSNPIGLWIDSQHDSTADGWGVLNQFATSNLTGNPTSHVFYEADLTHDDASGPTNIKAFYFDIDHQAGARTVTEMDGFHFDGAAELDATVTDFRGIRGDIGSGSGGTVTNLYGLYFDLDASNLGSTITRGMHLDLTAFGQGIFLDHNGTVGGTGWHGYELDADVTVAAQDYYGQRFNVNFTQGAGGPASVYGSRITAVDGNHVDNSTTLYGYRFDYNHTDASNRPTTVEAFSAGLDGQAAAAAGGSFYGFRSVIANDSDLTAWYGASVETDSAGAIDVSGNLYGYYALIDLSGAATKPTDAHGMRLDLTSVEQGAWIDMNGVVPVGGDQWTGLTVNSGGIDVNTNDNQIYRGIHIDQTGITTNAEPDNERVIGLEITMPTGTSQGIVFGNDNEVDIGRPAGAPNRKRPRTIYAATSVVIAATMAIDTNSITGSGTSTFGVAAGAFDLVLKMGDAAGAQKTSFTDSADAEVASLDSNGNFTYSGHKDTQVFVVNNFTYPAPATEWKPELDGAKLSASQATKIVYIPLPFLKVGDEIVRYALLGDATEITALTLDCVLKVITRANPITNASPAGGAIAQIAVDGDFDVTASLGGVETVALNKMYVLEITGTTGTGDAITVMGAEVTVNRK